MKQGQHLRCVARRFDAFEGLLNDARLVDQVGNTCRQFHKKEVCHIDVVETAEAAVRVDEQVKFQALLFP